MKWQRVFPRKIGFYWYSGGSIDLTIIKVWHDGREFSFFPMGMCEYSEDEFRKEGWLAMGSRWMGPLPQPSTPFFKLPPL